MKLSAEELERFLHLFESETTPLLATLEIGNCRASVSGLLAQGLVDEIPHLLIGDCGREFGNCIQFLYAAADCEGAYADLREVKGEPVDDLTDKIEGILTITHKKSGVRLGLYELKQ